MRTLLLLVAAALALPASAQHNARYTFSGPSTTTEVAGQGLAGSGYRAHPPPAQHGAVALHTLSFWESDGQPCQIEAGFWHAPDGFPLSAPEAQSTDRITYETHLDPGETEPGVMLDCGTSRRKRTVAAPFPTPEQDDDPMTATVGLWGHHGAAAIHGVQVCTDADGAVRGVKAYVSILNRNGMGLISREPSLADAFERRGCRTWSPPRRCPAGQVATTVEGHYRSGTLIGLSLVCRAVDVEPINGRTTRRR